MSNFHFLWSAFLETAAIIAIAFYEIGISAIPALALILVLIPVQVYLGRGISLAGRDQTKITTDRVHLMSEILTAVKLIKFYVWEKPFSEKIESLRKQELDLVYRGMIFKTINYMIVFAIPPVVALASLAMCMSFGMKLTATLSFTVLSVYNTLRYPFLMLPMAVKATKGAEAAFGRLDDFLLSEEVQPSVLDEKTHPDDYIFKMVKE